MLGRRDFSCLEVEWKPRLVGFGGGQMSEGGSRRFLFGGIPAVTRPLQRITRHYAKYRVARATPRQK